MDVSRSCVLVVNRMSREGGCGRQQGEKQQREREQAAKQKVSSMVTTPDIINEIKLNGDDTRHGDIINETELDVDNTGYDDIVIEKKLKTAKMVTLSVMMLNTEWK